ncbi:bifunctional phosphoribosylaminoimidazolecarboxamide formyltransferase/IMP cyclohydrolase [Anaerotalea alkaliphila]|uniref:Bifunctional purine biosynthesis protein PurH n=1 Tax=Anaerotalea alkaliphila TaxID=2662126 RepID=A0A7X5KPM8_9FIRM|nr:bifunctional phosphoribosylaminoimidazolecarboxamide formyltransferase/IMP cyclohydrolase [Anaerotalea alkaliphila]NDL68387.1 bifunctional phosphoribosylaminoimidazolecarboxamide formyltransferase/IMP cyclohydrolase [Anaerotalea alkaliphila]
MRALISVSDKTGIVDFAKQLQELGVEIISTGGTASALTDAGIPVIGISEVTGFPECLDGRVKTLDPHIHAGILAMRSNPEHMEQIAKLGVETIDLVVVNLYPFKQTILKEGVELEEAIENIDIGGPTMLRSAAKNYQDVSVIIDPRDYEKVLVELREVGKVSKTTNFYLSSKVFEHTASYDAMIADYMRKQRNAEVLPEVVTMTFEKVQDMRYGENPHQQAAFYKEIVHPKGTLASAVQLHGKELSFNNINDTNGALELLKEFDQPAVVACKHANPCGVGSADTIHEAYVKAYTSDPKSIFGGIVVANREVDVATAEEINKIFVEIVVAPSYQPQALEVLKKKKNIRILSLADITVKQPDTAYDLKKVGGGLLVQTIDNALLAEGELKVVTDRQPTEKEMEDLLFAWKIVKYAKSNGIAIGKDKQSLGVGPGQVNRIWACNQAIEHAVEALGADVLKGAALASDAFFPFPDCVEAAAAAGITAIIQPGGSMKDQDSIDTCNKYGIAMVFTGMRHFRH